MRKFAKAFILCCVAMHTAMACRAMDYSGVYMNGGHLNITQDSNFDHNSILNGTRLNITNPVMISNYGNIHAYIDMCDGCDVLVRNSGVFDIKYADVPRGNLFQIITSPDDMTPISFNGIYDIVVNGQHKLSMSKLLNVAQSANRMILNNSILEMDFTDMHSNIPINLIGEISIFLPSTDVLKSEPILHNVNGDGTVSIFAPDVDNLHAIQSYIIDGNVYGRIIRETDYYKILKNDTGKFLNTLRDIMPDDKLLGTLDTAETITDIDSIIQRSARLHPINLMRPIRVMHKYDILDFHQGGTASNIGASYFAIRSDSLNMYGINAGFAFATTDTTTIGTTVYYANGFVDDDINEYGIGAYGGRIYLNYDDGKFIANGNIGATIANFDIGPTIAGDNPHGMMIYGDTRGGYRFNITEHIAFMPFVGINGDVSYIANEHKFNTAINTGFEINIHDDCVGIGYDYGVRTMIDNTGTIGTMARLGIDIGNNAITFDMTAGVMHDNYTTSFRGGLQISIMF